MIKTLDEELSTEGREGINPKWGREIPGVASAQRRAEEEEGVWWNTGIAWV